MSHRTSPFAPLGAGLTALAVAAGMSACARTAPRNPEPTPAPAPTASTAAQRPAAGPVVAPPGAPNAGAGAARLRKFEEVTQGATAHPGFLDAYEKDGRVWLAIGKERLGSDMLLVSEIARGNGTGLMPGGTMLNIFEGWLVAFERQGDKVLLVRKPSRFTADADTPLARSVALTFAPSVIEQAAIASVRADSALLVDVTDWALSDLSDVGARMRALFSPRLGVPGRATLDRQRSYVQGVKAFPKNVNIRAMLTFTPGEPAFVSSVADSRYVPVGIHYSFVELPAVPMTPRLADDRMGYFMTVRKNFSGKDEAFFERFVNRWRLECAGPADAQGLCAPRKPITYYVDRTVPAEYAPTLMAGVTAWNRAFEAAGFRDAVRAEMLPEGADPEDVRYPTLRWNVSDTPGYGAIGPSFVDPRTGEILDADILFEASMIRGFERTWRTAASPAAALEALFAAPAGDDTNAGTSEHALFSTMVAAQGATLRTLLVARGEIGPDDPVPAAYVNQALMWVASHEVGHTLGLKHNFRSSTDTPLERLHDTTWTAARGVFSSMMEYPAVNLAPRGRPNGHYYNATVGTSDLWVIRYGYTPDGAQAREIARQAARAGHAYGSDEDAGGPGAIDPTVNIFDLGSDPLAWARERAALLESLVPELPRRALADDARYGQLTDAFGTVMGQYAQAVGTAVKYIGGQYQHRDHVGDPDARPPFVNVPRAKQREALQFLRAAAFDADAFAFPPEVLRSLGAQRWAHWGTALTYNDRIDYPVHEMVLNVQRSLLGRTLNPFVFARIHDAELKYGADQVLTIPELMGELTGSIWTEAATGARAATSMRRDLQRAYVARMEGIVLGTVPQADRMPADARAVARQELAGLERRIRSRLAAGGLDAYTRAHYAESAERIAKVLGASLDAQ